MTLKGASVQCIRNGAMQACAVGKLILTFPNSKIKYMQAPDELIKMPFGRQICVVTHWV